MYRVEVDVHAHTGASGRLRGGTGKTSGPQVLDADDQPTLIQLETRLDQLLLLERVAHLDTGPLLL
jgi:hypothetical protein